MVKNYDPNQKNGDHIVEVVLQQWDFKGRIRVEVSGNCKGLDVIGDIDKALINNYKDALMSDCDFKVIKGEVFRAKLRNANGDILEVEGDFDELREMIVHVEIIDFIHED